MPWLRVGAHVEVRRDAEGFQGVWYEAIVLRLRSRRPRCDIEYKHLPSKSNPSKLLCETVHSEFLRPQPPVLDKCSAQYTVDKFVEVFYKDGWWCGVVNAVLKEGRYRVAFPTNQEEMLVGVEEMRPGLEWVKGEWWVVGRRKMLSRPEVEMRPEVGPERAAKYGGGHEAVMGFEGGPDVGAESSGLENCKRKAHHRGNSQDIQIAKKTINWNAANQPLGDGKSKLSSFLGEIVKGHFPLHVLDWYEQSKTEKDTVWGIVKSAWELEDIRKDWVMNTMGEMWWEWKFALSVKLAQYIGKPDALDLIQKLKPEQVSEEAWESFVESTLTDAFKETSEMSRVQAQSVGNVTRGEGPEVPRLPAWIKSYLHKGEKNSSALSVPVNKPKAVFIEKMVEVHPSQDIMENPVAIVHGPEHPERVRAASLGPAPSTMKQTDHSAKTMEELWQENKKILEENKQLKERQERLEAQFHALVKEIREQDSHAMPGLPAAPGVELHGKKCKLLHYDSSDPRVVAEAVISGTDPLVTCQGQQISQSCYKVEVVKVIEGSLNVAIPSPGIGTLEEAVGKFILWPRMFINLQ